MRFVAALLAVLLLAIWGACGGDDPAPIGEPAPEPTGLPVISLTGGQFTDGGAFPFAFSCDGVGKSPTILWTGLPVETESIVVWLNDVDAQNFVHWLVFDVPPNEDGLTPGIGDEPVLGDGAHQAKNNAERIGYTPPCPPEEQSHHYVFRVYALNKTLGLAPGVTAAEVAGAMSPAIIAYGKMTATYARPAN